VRTGLSLQGLASLGRVRLRPGRELPGGPGLRISARPDVGPV